MVITLSRAELRLLRQALADYAEGIADAVEDGDKRAIKADAAVDALLARLS